jgi:hypothetical protein
MFHASCSLLELWADPCSWSVVPKLFVNDSVNHAKHFIYFLVQHVHWNLSYWLHWDENAKGHITLTDDWKQFCQGIPPSASINAVVLLDGCRNMLLPWTNCSTNSWRLSGKFLSDSEFRLFFGPALPRSLWFCPESKRDEPPWARFSFLLVNN